VKHQHDGHGTIVSFGSSADTGVALDHESIIGKRTKVIEAIEVGPDLCANVFTN
jgi:hypothetical protein